MSEQGDTPLKVVIVGDDGVGKSSFAIVLSGQQYPSEAPGVAEIATYTFEEATEAIDVWDTTSQEDSPRFRAVSYFDADVVLCCFSCTSRESMKACKRYMREAKRHVSSANVMMVCLKTDLRDSNDAVGESAEQLISEKEAQKAAVKYGFEFYHECSALNGNGVQELRSSFCEVIAESFRRKNTPSKGLFQSIKRLFS